MIHSKKSKYEQACGSINMIVALRIAKIQDTLPLMGRLIDLSWSIITGDFFSQVRSVKAKMQESVFFDHKTNHGKNPPLISVVIPTLNEVNWLNNCLLSLSYGRYPNYEIIIVDGFSTDGTVDLAKKMGAKIVFSRSKSMSQLIHLGCRKARGNIILKTDADTIFPPKILPTIAEVFTRNPDVQVCNVGHVYYDSGLLVNLFAHYYDERWRKSWNTSGHFIAFRKSALQLISFRAHAGEDYMFGYDAFKTFGPQGVWYDPNIFVLVSSRAIKKYGLIRHTLGRSRSYKSPRL